MQFRTHYIHSRMLILHLVGMLFWVFGLGGCQQESPSEILEGKVKLRVAAAANLKFVFEELKTEFEQEHPEIQLEVTYGSSGNFFAQLTQQAPFDVFFSADTTYPRKLVAENLAEEDAYFPYAQGRIVLWVKKSSQLDLQDQEMNVLRDPSVKQIAIANPRLAPYGVAAEEALKSAEIHEHVKDRLVQGENITQTAHFVQSGAADVGVLALSLALAPEMQESGRYWEVPADWYSPIEQAGVILSRCENPEAAALLREFVLGPKGRKILSRYGYAAPKEEAWTGPQSD